MVPARTLDPAWSPDGKWLAYAKRLDSQLHAVFVYNLADKRITQLTDGLSDAVSPVFDTNGKYLYFLASTDFGLNTGWLEMATLDRPVTRALYLAVLRKDEPSPFLPASDEEKATPDSAKAPTPEKGGAPSPRRLRRLRVQIDLDGISQRILAIDVPAKNYADLLSSTPGSVVFTESSLPFASPSGSTPPTFTVHRYDITPRKAQQLIAGVSGYAMSNDGKKLLYRQGPNAFVVDADKPAVAGAGKLNLALRMQLDPRAEWKQMFREAWRLQRDFFYVPNIHGANWHDMWDKYSPWVDHVGHRADLSYLLDILGGETSVGHSFVFGGDMPSFDRPTIGMLGADLTVENGRFRIARILGGENWNPDLQAPLSAPGVDVREGDYLLAVNGVEVRAASEPWAYLEGTAGKQTVLTVNQRPTLEGARQVTVVPVPSEDGLRSRAWVENNRRIGRPTVRRQAGVRLAA